MKSIKEELEKVRINFVWLRDSADISSEKLVVLTAGEPTLYAE